MSIALKASWTYALGNMKVHLTYSPVPTGNAPTGVNTLLPHTGFVLGAVKVGETLICKGSQSLNSYKHYKPGRARTSYTGSTAHEQVQPILLDTGKWPHAG